MSPHFTPVVIDGLKFDRGMILAEFDALREPEKTIFPRIGQWLRERCPMVEVSTPKMYWRGKCWPDVYIANRLEAIPGGWKAGPAGYRRNLHPRNKAAYRNEQAFDLVSIENHGAIFHAEFIESMCRKFGTTSRQVSARFHRALWLPLYWPQTLRSRTSLRTAFWYPRAGYAGAIREAVEPEHHAVSRGAGAGEPPSYRDTANLSLTFVVGKPVVRFSVLFVVDDWPIYRITNHDECAGAQGSECRFVVESSRPIDVAYVAPFIAGARVLGRESINFVLPTVRNVLAGWRPRPHMNDQLLQHMGEAVET